jgi:hypothetical protein
MHTQTSLVDSGGDASVEQPHPRLGSEVGGRLRRQDCDHLPWPARRCSSCTAPLPERSHAHGMALWVGLGGWVDCRRGGGE